MIYYNLTIHEKNMNTNRNNFLWKNTTVAHHTDYTD